MNPTKRKSKFFAGLAGLLMALSVLLSFCCQNRLPMLFASPTSGAQEQVQELMHAICSGDYTAAQERIYGNPDLGMEEQPTSEVNRLFWNAYLESLDYELTGPLYTAETGVVQDVKLICLDLPETTKNLGVKAQALMELAVEQAEDVSEIYDPDNSYKESFLEEVMVQATLETLEEAQYTYHVIPVQLKYSDDQWWIVADEVFLNAISGTAAGQEG